MSQRAEPPRAPAARAGAGEDRFDALLEERFSGRAKSQMAREVAEHDRRSGRAAQAAPGVMPVEAPPPPFDKAHVARKIRFTGEIAEPLQKLLRAAIPDLLAHAAERGLRLRDQNHEIRILSKAAYEAETRKPVPPALSLPAASYRHLPIARIYEVRVVLSDRPTGTAEAVAILRVVMARLLGDIFLKEEVFSRAAYQEDLAPATGGISAALEDQMALLAEAPETTPALERALAAHAKRMSLESPKARGKVRAAFFAEAAQALARQKLSPETEALVKEAFAGFVARFTARLDAGLAETVALAEKLNRQLNFLPPDETPEYLALQARNPRHYLRSAQLRLEHQLEVLGTVLDGAAALEQPGGASPLVEEQIEGHLSELRRQNLARPYLVPGVALSDELEAKRAALPFEIHAILSRMPPRSGTAEKPAQAFQAMQRRLAESLYQRLYTALLGLKTWLRLREQGKHQDFLGGERHRALKGQLSNFRFRLPLLRAMNARLGIVLDILDAHPEEGRAGFPIEPFARAWSHFVSFRVTGEALAGSPRLLPRFDAAAYWRGMDQAVRQALARGAGYFHVVYLLGRLRERAAAEAKEDGLRVLAGLLPDPPGTWRFVIQQALSPALEGDPAARLVQLDEWAGIVLEARRRSLEHAIGTGRQG